MIEEALALLRQNHYKVTKQRRATVSVTWAEERGTVRHGNFYGNCNNYLKIVIDNVADVMYGYLTRRYRQNGTEGGTGGAVPNFFPPVYNDI